MTDKTMRNMITIILGMAGMVLLPGCSTSPGLLNEKGVTIERINSDTVHVTRAYLEASDTTLALRGELKRRLTSRRPIPGYLRIQLIDSDGRVFKEANIGSRRSSVKSRIARFYLPIPVELSKLSTVRIIHHDEYTHMANTQMSPWRDVN